MEVFTLKEHVDVLVVEVDIGMIPSGVRQQHMESIKKTIKETFPNNKVLVIPSKSKINIVQIN